MAGKWHLGHNDQDCWPLQRGFEKYFGCISGGDAFLSPGTAARDDLRERERREAREHHRRGLLHHRCLHRLRGSISCRKKLSAQTRPFFLYLAYTAPHWPLQAFEDDIAKYRGKYRIGWDKLREQRYRRQIELGLIDAEWKLSPRTPGIPDWDTLDERSRTRWT